MRHMAWMVTAGLILGLSAGTAAADSDVYPTAKELAAKKPTSSSSWWPFGSKKEKEPPKADKPKPPPPVDKEKAKSAAKAPPLPKPEPDPGLVIAQEREKFLRRQQVCDKLRHVAHEQGDARLEAQAEALEKQAWNLYSQRVAFAQAAGTDLFDTAAAATRLTTPSPAAAPRTATERPVRSITARNTGTPSEKE